MHMMRIHPECRNPSDQSVIAELIFRQEPDEEEDEQDNEVTAKKMRMTTDRTTATRNRWPVNQPTIGYLRIQLPIPIQRSLLHFLLIEEQVQCGDHCVRAFPELLC